MFRYLRSRVTVAQFDMGGARVYSAGGHASGARRPGAGPRAGNGPGDVIDGEFTEVPGEGAAKKPGQRPSGWVEGPDRP